jgi:Ferredoxin thioredoxin reductase variable alpha chain
MPRPSRRASHSGVDVRDRIARSVLPPMQPGDQVTVCRSVIVYHHPKHRGTPFDLEGQKGEVENVLQDWEGRPISPTLPIVVAFGRFKVHFREDELALAPEDALASA